MTLDPDPRIRPRTTGEVHDDAWRFALADAPALLALSGLFAVPAFAVVLLLLTRPAPTDWLSRLALPAAAALLVPLTGLGSGACQELLRRRLDGRPVSLSGCLGAALAKAPGQLVGRGVTLVALAPGFGLLAAAAATAGRVGALPAVLLGLFGLFLSCVAMYLTSAISPAVAAGDLPPFAALSAALSRELRRGSTKAVAAAVSRVALLLFGVVNLHLLVAVGLIVAGHLAGLETARVELLLTPANPAYALTVVAAAWLLLTPFAEAVGALLAVDGRVRFDGLDLSRRVQTLFPISKGGGAALALVAAALLGGGAFADDSDRLTTVRAVRAEVGRILAEVRTVEPYRGAAYAERLERLAARLAAGDGGRTRWFRASLDGFAARARPGALEVLEELEGKLAALEESLTPENDDGGAPRRGRADVKALVPGSTDAPDRPKKRADPTKDDELKRPTVRRDEPGEGGPRGGGGPGMLAPQVGAGFAVLGWAVLGGLLLAVVALAVVLWLRRRREPDEAPPVDGPLSPTEAPAFEPERQTADALWRRAEGRARAGEFLEALRLLHLAALARLHEADLVRFEPTRTNGEVLRQLRSVEGAEAAVEPFGRLTRLFERRWYGDRTADEEDYEKGREWAERLR